MGAQGRVAIRERLVSGMERITFYVAPTVALYIAAGDVIVGALLQRGQFEAQDSRLVWLVLAAFALGLLGTTRSRLLQNGLYALDRPKLVARTSVLRVALAAILGAALLFPLARRPLVRPSLPPPGPHGFRPLAARPRLGPPA